jgi:magnesium transporter
MSSKYRKRRRKKLFTRQPDVSLTPPGTTAGAGGAEPGEIELIAFGPHNFVEKKYDTAGFLAAGAEHLPVQWVNLDGTGDVQLVESLGKMFGLHELAVEDIVNLHQRAKVDEYQDHLFIVLRMPSFVEDHLVHEQVCIVLGKSFVLTFQETPGGDCFDPVRERIRKGYGHLRSAGPDYLMYAIVDSVVDSYFPILERLGEMLEDLEDVILERYDRTTPSRIMELKREILSVRRAVWPAREALNVLVRDQLSNVHPSTQIYLRDCYDHVVRIIDLVETQREICSDLMDLHLSSMSNRMNEVMKVLTMITLLFMPPTLVAGIYGMNFNTNVSQWNMPELNWPFGYIFALCLMLASALIVYSIAKLRGWLQDDEMQAPPQSQ